VLALELIRMIKTEPRKKPRMEIIKSLMKLGFHEILLVGPIGGKTCL